MMPGRPRCTPQCVLLLVNRFRVGPYFRSRAGRPEFGLDVDNIRPMQVVVGAALAMLALGKPLSGSRGFGGLQFGLPVSGDAVAKVRP